MDRACEQYKSLQAGLQTIGGQKGWQIQQLVFVGGSMRVSGEDAFNENMKLL